MLAIMVGHLGVLVDINVKRSDLRPLAIANFNELFDNRADRDTLQTIEKIQFDVGAITKYLLCVPFECFFLPFTGQMLRQGVQT
jgi:hypothetical protein